MKLLYVALPGFLERGGYEFVYRDKPLNPFIAKRYGHLLRDYDEGYYFVSFEVGDVRALTEPGVLGVSTLDAMGVIEAFNALQGVLESSGLEIVLTNEHGGLIKLTK